MWHGPARQAGARAASHHRNLQRVAGFEHGLHLRFGFGQRHDQGALSVGGQAVALIGRGVFGGVKNGISGQHPAQGLHHSALALGTFGGGQLLSFGVGVGAHGIQNLESGPQL